MGFIFFLSSVPGKDIPDIPVPYFHKGAHFCEYSVLAGLWIRAFLLRRPDASRLKSSVLAWILTTLFAFSDEWHQGFVPGRLCKLEDALSDMIWTALGILFYLYVRHKPGHTKDSRRNN
jgi:VanZ family protein